MNKYTKIFLIVVMGVAVLTCFSYVNATKLESVDAVSGAAQGPQPLFGSLGGSDNFSSFLVWLYGFALSAAGILAVLMIVVAGIQYIVSGGNSSKRTDAKNRIEQALWGLLLALTAYLILYTLNPELIKSGLDGIIPPLDELAPGNISGVNDGAQIGSSGGAQSGVQGSGSGSIVLTKLRSEGVNVVPLKSGICGGDSNNCQFEKNISNKLEVLNEKLISSGFGRANWQVTEGYPPMYEHKNACHSNGTCFDANFAGLKKNDPTPMDINSFNKTAGDSGLKSVYEVKEKAEYDQLVKDGAKSISYNPNASANHFHIISQ